VPSGLYELYEGDVKRISKTGSPEAMTPDGKTIVFTDFRNHLASADLTGSNEKDPFSGEAVERYQLYRYSDRTGFVECVSCKGTAGPQEAGIGGSVGTLFKMSADGNTIAFLTDSKLDENDINGRVDVYEWHNGVTRLVTDGESEFSQLGTDSPGLWNLSKDGRTIIFGEGGVPITGNEIDHLTNAYAAVVGAHGFPPPNPPAHCVEDSCQGPLQPTPVLETQGSEKFRGQDNPVPHRKHHPGKRNAKHRKHKHNKHRKHARHATHRHG
jgi:Tol biopolymer transport system component